MRSRPFLQTIAEHFYKAHRAELFRYRFFFQNRRAALFFQRYLMELAKEERQTIILPETTSLSEYIRVKKNLSEEDPNINIEIIYELYLASKEVELPLSSSSSFSDFYHLGEYILTDFDDLDKYLKDPEKIYTNASDLSALTVDIATELSEDQKAALARFVHTLERGRIDPAPPELEKKFVSIFSKMPALYQQTKKRLKEEGLYYTGMLYREALEELEAGGFDIFDDKINVFSGLNVLPPVEQKLLQYFQRKSTTYFYWDYFSPLLSSDTLAGGFQNENLSRFPMPTGSEQITFDYSNQLPKVEVVSLPSKVAQCVYLGNNVLGEVMDEWISKLKNLEVAIVLPNERLLMPLLSNLPATNQFSVNVTMGYPIKETPLVGTLLRILHALNNIYLRGSNGKVPCWRGKDALEILASLSLAPIFKGTSMREEIVDTILQKQYFDLTKESLNALCLKLEVPEEIKTPLEEIFQVCPEDYASSKSGLWLIRYFITLLSRLQSQNKPDEDEETEECIYRAEETLIPFILELLRKRETMMRKYLSKKKIGEDATTFSWPIVTDLLKTIWTQARIPYRGEPLKGLQIMGLLETRSLDFDVLLIPDATEGVLPTKSNLKSILPHILRLGHGLPTYQWQEQTRAYNFFRLLSRSSKVICTYDSRKNDTSEGEPSRYIRILDYFYPECTVRHTVANYPLLTSYDKVSEFLVSKSKIEAYQQSISPRGEAYLSASKINDFITCPRLFYAKHIEGWAEPKNLDELIDAKDLGTIIHGTLESLYASFEGKELDKERLEYWLKTTEGKNNVRQEIEHHYGRLFHTKQPTGYNQLLISEAEQLLFNMIALDLDNLHEISTYIGGEIGFKAEITLPTQQKLKLKGFIDRLQLVENNQILEIIDYKTGQDDYFINLDSIANTDQTDFNTAGNQLLLYTTILSHPQRFSARLYNRADETIQIPNLPKRPRLYKPRTTKTHKYLTIGEKESTARLLTHFLPEEQERYTEILIQKLLELMNPNQEFLPRKTLSKKSCHYCPLKEQCSTYNTSKI